MATKFKIDFNPDKNLLLKSTRGICFDDVIEIIKKGQILANLRHKSRKNQRVFVLKINNYAYVVPFIIDLKRKVIFLKTVYPSRIFTNKYLRK